MRPFVFKEVEYKDLNSLGVAFASNFKEAMEVVATKEFLNFVKHFKKVYDKLADAFYRTRYVQNLLTLVIYTITDDTKFVVFGKEYKTLQELAKDIDKPGFKLLAEEKIFSKTFINSASDEKIKLDLLTLQDNYEDEFAIKYVKTYFEYDSIETLETSLSEIYNSSDEQFKRAHELFSSEKIQLLLAHKYSLEAVISLRKAPSPVFMGLELIQGEMSFELISNILENGFYYFLLENIKQYKFKGNSKKIKENLLDCKKAIKKQKKPTVNFLCSKCLELYKYYIMAVEAYKEGKIKVKSEEYGFTANYANTLIPVAYVSSHHVKLSEDESLVKLEEEKLTYNVNVFEKAMKKYRRFKNMNIFFFIILALYVGVAYLLKMFELADIMIIMRDEADYLPLIVYAGGLAVMLVFGIFVGIKVRRNQKRFNKLCKLEYYRKNQLILTEREKNDFNKLVLKEAKIVKKINRGYRFWAGLVLAGFATSIAVLTITIINMTNILPLEDLLKVPYLIFVPAGVNFLFALFRKRKSAFSFVLALVFSIAAIIGCIYLAPML